MVGGSTFLLEGAAALGRRPRRAHGARQRRGRPRSLDAVEACDGEAFPLPTVSSDEVA